MLILDQHNVRQALPMAQTIAAMKQAYAALANGQAQVPLRAHLPVPPHNGASLFMPAYLRTEQGEALAVKTVSVFPGNPARGLPLIHAAVLLLEADTGRPLALLEGSALTAIRTGAASGAASDLLARPDARTAAIFGAGVQGRTQLEAICTVREIETAWVFDPLPERAATFVRDLAGQGRIPHDLRVAADPTQAASSADILCTATASTSPVYPASAIRPGTHINGVGSYTLAMIENPPELLARSVIFVDSCDAVLAEAGEIVAAIERGLISPAQLTELGNVVLQKAPARANPTEITFFKSVGVAVQDALAARLALQNAAAMNLGQSVPW